MYVEIKTKLLSGVFEVKEIIGNIICIDNNGTSYDCYLSNGEIKRFCTKEGKNLSIK